MGIALFALPVSVLSALIATSRYYSMDKVFPLLAPARVHDISSPPRNDYLAIDEKGRHYAMWLVKRS